MKLFLDTYGATLSNRVSLLSYERLFRLKSLPIGTYIFADYDQLTHDETDKAIVVWNALSASGRDLHLLNHPARSMRRFELLRHLYAAKINDFNVYRLTDTHQPVQFPVFVRSERQHHGSMTLLLHDQRELQTAINRLQNTGHNRDDKMIMEFCDVSDATGLYHVYSAMLIGSEVTAIDLTFSTYWMNKGGLNSQDLPNLKAIEHYVHTNPHEALLRPIFHIARIDFGRIDYALVNGDIRVFEINVNPTIIGPEDLGNSVWRLTTQHFASNLMQAFENIDCEEKPKSSISFTKPPEFWWESSGQFHLIMLIQKALCFLRLSRYDEVIISKLSKIYSLRKVFRSFLKTR